jgi:hypothetical protein
MRVISAQEREEQSKDRLPDFIIGRTNNQAETASSLTKS